MTTQRLLIGAAEPLADDEVAIVAITPGVKRDQDFWEPGGVDLTNYKRNPVLLDSHNPTKIIGITAMAYSGYQIEGRAKFAPLGISEDADQARGLAKKGFLVGVSAGIDPIEVEPLDPRNPRGGMRVLRCELLEISLVAVQADPDARIIARSYSGTRTRAALLRRLPTISPASVDRLRAMLDRPSWEKELIAAAAEFGEQLTPGRIAQLAHQARACGRSPAQQFRWLRAAYGAA